MAYSLYLQLRRGRLEARKFADILLFIPFTTKLMKRPALQNKRVAVLRMAFRARKVFETFEKRAPDSIVSTYLRSSSCLL